MNYNSKKNLELAKSTANLKDMKSMKALFNAAASAYYIEHTAKSWEELLAAGWLSDSQFTDWARDCAGDEWGSIEECIACAEDAAAAAIELDGEQ